MLLQGRGDDVVAGRGKCPVGVATKMPKDGLDWEVWEATEPERPPFEYDACCLLS